MPRYCDNCNAELTSDEFEGHDVNGMSIYKCSECGKTDTNDW